MSYHTEQIKAEAAYQQYNYAGQKLENARIHARLAEIKEQHEPLASLMAEQRTERDRLYAAAFYVVVGRMPEATP